MPRLLRLTTATVSAALIALACPLPVAAETFSASDIRDIETAYAAYGAAWLANDRQAVLATLAEDVVLMPSGLAPIEGQTGAAAFWWPDDGSTTTITAYESSIAEVRGAGDLAVVRAQGGMTFTWEKDGQASEQTNRSMSLTVLERGGDGRWRISLRMWGRTP